MTKWLARFSFILPLILAVSMIVPPAFAGNAGTPAEAKAMAISAANLLQTKGPEVAFPEFDKGAAFHNRDLYVMVFNQAGTCVAHGANAALIGKSLINLKDSDGVYMVKEIVAVKNTGWVNYDWPDPATNKIAAKTTYVVHVGKYFVGVGAYK